jgi:SAM-dependent methyltransferase
MTTVAEHYETLLAARYTWMYGGWEAKVEENRAFFGECGLLDGSGKTAVDLGAGSGFQSVPLAEAGYAVYAIDLSATLLDELRGHARGLPVTCVHGDLMNFEQMSPSPVDLAVCMTDTILHLPSSEAIALLMTKVWRALKPGGRFVISFRDLSVEPPDLDRFIAVQSDEDILFTCVLEFDPEHVKVFDLVYTRGEGRWDLQKSFYRKVRVSLDWMKQALCVRDFRVVYEDSVRGMNRLVAVK